MKVSEIVAKYPSISVWNTGGNCTAYAAGLDGGRHFLITDVEDAHIPDDDATEVMCGLYDEEGSMDANEEGELIAVENLEAWIVAHLPVPELLGMIEAQQAIQMANSPKTKVWQDASDALQPLFAEMASRQKAGKL
jgi:hypothetical protein